MKIKQKNITKSEHGLLKSELAPLERQVKGVMGTRPAAHRFAHPADDGQLVGVGTRRHGGEGRSRDEGGLEGPAALATAPHLPPADEEGEHRESRLRGGEASFGENVARQTCRTLVRPGRGRSGALHGGGGGGGGRGASQGPEEEGEAATFSTANPDQFYVSRKVVPT